ncbi:MAG: TonB-dependent receptor plug domain-containing protein, partial [Bacteroidales bacterium]|nr:TonB-dependent receptor plug domain-containing protein [Bacteroidales bacterium]
MATFAINNQKRSLISFNQWTNKKYAVFNSLKRIIKIASLSVAYSIIAIPELSIAQTDSSGVVKNLDLEEVVVSAERSPVVFSKIARVVTVITDKDAQGLPGNSLNELIERSSFVDIRQRGTNGIQADISIRGGTFDQNLVLLNGINITDPQTGHHSLNLPIDLNAVQRIE